MAATSRDHKHMTDHAPSDTHRPAAGDGGAAQAGAIDSVLLVEDSLLIAMEAEDTLRALGVADVQVADSVASAMSSLDRTTPRFAILDYQLGDESSLPVAQRLRTAGIPFALATGYSELRDETESMGAARMLIKPYGRRDLAQALEHAGR